MHYKITHDHDRLKKTSSMQSKRRDLHHTWLHRETNEKLNFFIYPRAPATFPLTALMTHTPHHCQSTYFETASKYLPYVFLAWTAFCGLESILVLPISGNWASLFGQRSATALSTIVTSVWRFTWTWTGAVSVWFKLKVIADTGNRFLVNQVGI